jgi:hypothetical protein
LILHNRRHAIIGKDGPLGIAVKELNDNLTTFVEFETVSTNVEVLDIKIFNGRHEHIMFYELCRGVASGVIDKKYENMEGPTISSCRWRTYFIRLLEATKGQVCPTLEKSILKN